MKKIKFFFKKYVNGTQGVISLFLALVMIPFVSIGGALINASRINSAVAIFDEALCNASNSTLGTYDDFLRERFALMAISQDTAKGAQKFGKTASGYTADAFINDMFRYYMEKNLSVLSNTYDKGTLNAVGIYPLADPTILKMAVTQAGKITVPAKLAVDWGSIDDMISMLTKPFDILSSFTSLLSSGAEAVTAIDELNDAETAVKEQIDACNTAKTECYNAYTAFTGAVSNYNGLIDSISYWQGEVNRLQIVFDELKNKASSINSQIVAAENQIKTLQNDKSKDHSQEISELNKKIIELKEEREKVAPGYSQTESDLDSAKTNLQNCINDLPNKRTDVKNAKTTYYNKIIALRDQINTTRDAAIEFQNAGKNLANKGAEVVVNVASTGFAVANECIEKNEDKLKEENEYYKYQQTLAEGSGTVEDATHYYNLIQENNSTMNNLENTSLKYDNIDTTISALQSASENVTNGLTDFANRNLTAEYKIVYDALDTLSGQVNSISIPETQNKVTNYNYYKDITQPLSKENITSIVDTLSSQIASNGGWAVLKLVINFFKELISLELWYDSSLKSTINQDHYTSIGGLPSKRTNTNYTSPYDSADKALAESNKIKLNAYSDVEVYEVQGSGLTDFELLVGYIETIGNLISPFKLKNIKELWEAAKGAIGCITNIAGSIISDGVNSLVKGLISRFILVGYLSYNTANRTTYKGSGLTGTAYGLPSLESNEGYVFSGAETEYIFKGSMEETKNQKAVFNSIWVERMLFDIAGVLADTTVQTLATTLGSVTFGIGTVITYIVFIALEGLVDAIVLVNGGDIPILKTFIFLSPGGILKLVEKICSLKLSDATKQSLYEKAGNCAYNLNEGAKNKALEHGKFAGDQTVNLPAYNDYKSTQQQSDKKFTNIFTLDYTKSLQIIMLLFGNSDKMVKRFADIIQMEATYKAKQGLLTYNFDLAKSYTYLRVEGNFGSDVFLRVGSKDKLNSNNRVIYNGY